MWIKKKKKTFSNVTMWWDAGKYHVKQLSTGFCKKKKNVSLEKEPLSLHTLPDNTTIKQRLSQIRNEITDCYSYKMKLQCFAQGQFALKIMRNQLLIFLVNLEKCKDKKKAMVKNKSW